MIDGECGEKVGNGINVSYSLAPNQRLRLQCVPKSLVIQDMHPFPVLSLLPRVPYATPFPLYVSPLPHPPPKTPNSPRPLDTQ